MDEKIISLRQIKFFIAIVLGLNALFGVWIALEHLNFLQVDLAGHLWSSVQFGRGLFHSFSDQIFLGYIHDLFYPPLEDFLIFITRTILGGDLFFSYQCYIALLVLFYFYAIWTLIKAFNFKASVLFIAIAILYLVDMEKAELLKLQGLSLIDLFVTGLSSEILAFGFFLILLQQTLFTTYRSRTKIVLLLALTILSHIVIGFVAVLWILIQSFIQKSERKFEFAKIAFFGLGLSAFYWVPFVYHGQYIPAASIFNYPPWPALSIATLGLVFSVYKKNRKSFVLFGLAAVLLSTTAVGGTFDVIAALMPKFHYYRFTMVGYFLIVIAIALLFEKIEWNISILKIQNAKTLFPLLLSVALFVHLLTSFGLQDFNFHWTSFSQTTVDYSQVGKVELPDYGRYLVLGDDRAADIGLDSLLAAQYETFRTTKGLFWESSRTNNLQSSFLATLLAPPVVLDFYYADDFDCNIQKCLLEQDFQYYNIKGLVGNPKYLSYLPKEKRACWQDILSNGTEHFQFQRTGEMRASNRIYPIFQNRLKPEATLRPNFSTDVVVPIDKTEIRLPASEKEILSPYSVAIDEADKACLARDTAGLHLLARKQDWEQISKDLNQQSPATSRLIPFRKISDNSFQVQLPSDQKRLYAIKLSPQPGARAFTDSHELVPLFETYPYILIYGSGNITLEFAPTLAMRLGCLLSVATLLLAISTIRNKKVTLPQV